MAIERSCGAVLFTEKDGERLYLITCGRSGHIAFPKGHMEAGETERQTAIREILEETGVTVTDADFIEGFAEPWSYRVKRTGNKKIVLYFLAHMSLQKPRRQESELQWARLIPYGEAMKLVNTQRERDILTMAEELLSGR